MNPATGLGSLFSSTTTAYDAAGRQTLVTDGNGHHVGYQYDPDGNVTLTTFDDRTTVTDTYDAAGRKQTETDQNGKVTTYGYDVAGHLTEVDQPQVNDPQNGNVLTTPVTTYVYDSFGNETQQIDALHRVTTFGYDAYGQQTSRHLPDIPGQASATEQTTYDKLGRATHSVDFDGNITDYTYDSQGRQLTVSYTLHGTSSPQETVTHGYDGLGRETSVNDSASGVTAYAYDTGGHVTQVTSPQGVVNHTYDPASGELIRTWTGDGALDESFRYDPLGRLYTVTVTKLNNLAVDQVTTYLYDLAGNLASTTTDTGVATLTTTYHYDDLNRLTTLTNAAGGNTLSSFAYQYDYAGHRTHVVEVGVDGPGVTRAISYGYDALYRLTSESDTVNGATTTTSYTYDLVGNRLAETTGGTTNTYGYDARDRLTTETDAGTTYNYSYDTNGAQLTKFHGGVTDSTYTYDARGRMISATTNGVTETYTYDDNGNRLTVASNATGSPKTTQYLFDDANPTGYPQVLEEAVGGATTAVYAYGSQRLSITTIAEGTHEYLYDGHGSIRQLVNTIGTVTDRDTYDSFGTVILSSGTTSNVYLFMPCALTAARSFITTCKVSGNRRGTVRNGGWAGIFDD